MIPCLFNCGGVQENRELSFTTSGVNLGPDEHQFQMERRDVIRRTFLGKPQEYKTIG